MATRVKDVPDGRDEGSRISVGLGGRRKGQKSTGPLNAEFSLSAFTIFSGLSRPTIRAIEDLCDQCVYPPGANIIERGQQGDDIFFLVDGVAQVLSYTDSGRAVAFAQLQNGDYFGELAAIDDRPRSATVVAHTACEMAILPGQEFIRLMSSHPTIAHALLRKLAGVIRAGDERIVDLSVLGAEQRVCVELLKLAKPNPASPGGDLEIYPVPTQKFLSREIGVTRETVARIFSHLMGEGIIKRKSNILYICDGHKLEQAALSTGAVKRTNE